MDEYNKYAALADTIKIEDITSCERKQNILQQIKDNDKSFDNVWICKGDQVHDKFDYDPNNSDELAWLGYYIGQSASVEKLYISIDLSLFNNPGREVFFRGLGNNRSIYFLSFDKFNLSEGRLFSVMNSFLKDNTNLSAIGVYGCQLAGAEGVRQLSLALGGCNPILYIKTQILCTSPSPLPLFHLSSKVFEGVSNYNNSQNNNNDDSDDDESKIDQQPLHLIINPCV